MEDTEAHIAGVQANDDNTCAISIEITIINHKKRFAKMDLNRTQHRVLVEHERLQVIDNIYSL